MCLSSSLTGRGQTASSVGVSKCLSSHRAATSTARSPARRLPHHLPTRRRSHQPPCPFLRLRLLRSSTRARARTRRTARLSSLAHDGPPPRPSDYAHWPDAPSARDRGGRWFCHVLKLARLSPGRDSRAPPSLVDRGTRSLFLASGVTVGFAPRSRTGRGGDWEGKMADFDGARPAT